MVYRRRAGSGPAEQRKKMDLDWKSGSATASGTRSFLQLADTAPNVGANLVRREEERGNE
jgi:alpha-L-arabinofuranosidase